jgi:DNA-binding NarL/FixJ family response regulator
VFVWTDRQRWRACLAAPGVRSGPAQNCPENLTQREREVLALVAEGRTNGGIAERMVITEGSVQKFVR